MDSRMISIAWFAANATLCDARAASIAITPASRVALTRWYGVNRLGLTVCTLNMGGALLGLHVLMEVTLSRR